MRALSAEIGAKQPWDSLTQLRRAMVEAVPHLGDIDMVPENDMVPLEEGTPGSSEMAPAIASHYLTNPILRASKVMGELTAMAAERQSKPLAAE